MRRRYGVDLIDHLQLQCDDLARSAAFYDAVLAPLGGTRILEHNEAIGYGVTYPHFWLGQLSDEYHDNYYGAFVRDPDGHNVEAVCHDPA